MSRWATAAVLAALACAPSAADHEVLGDRNYVAGAYADALAEYQLGLRAGGARADLHAKAGAAALHTGDFSVAAQEFRALAREDPSRADEAVDGLERAARGAVTSNDRVAMAQALQGIREIAPSRPLGAYARIVALDAAAAGNTADAMAYLPTAIATAPDARTADSLLYMLGEAAALAKDCVTAMAVFEGVLQRQRQPAVQDAAREGIARCALMRGQAALAAGRPGDAEEWFRRAATPGSAIEVTRAAYVGLGDVALARGDVAAAVDFYQQSLIGGVPGDSLAQRAQEKLNALGRADSASVPPQP
ncbi:MAG TPA: tetratricopeptide repeat protein [Gemmatimonadales bacterium]|nr:tetratricopeptide repeat protein [Gemmatimonadales bacterium]